MDACDRCGTASDGGVEKWEHIKGQEPRKVETVCHACAKTERISEYRRTGVLSNKAILPACMYMQDVGYMTGGLDGGWVDWMRGPERKEQRLQIGRRVRKDAHLDEIYCKIAMENDRVHAIVKEFETAVWFRWLKDYWNRATLRGHEAAIPDLTMLVWGCAGRLGATLQDPIKGHSVTVLTDESSDNPVMGMQGIDATCEGACALLRLACNETEALRRAIHPEPKVGMF